MQFEFSSKHLFFCKTKTADWKCSVWVTLETWAYSHVVVVFFPVVISERHWINTVLNNDNCLLEACITRVRTGEHLPHKASWG